MSEVTREMANEHGLNDEEFAQLCTLIGRIPNKVELGLFSAMWSEHCSYKSTRTHLGKLPTKAPWVICGPGENAGIIDVGDNQAVVFKMESHNHPSFIEPYQGAATGVGGIMRDVFTMGARPFASLNALRFGEIDHPKTRQLLSGVVGGIGGYGNCVGVPTVGGECNFHSAYNGNILVNAMCAGLVEHDKIFYSAASYVGAPVFYVGSHTGRDGIHGATMSSAEFDDDSVDNRPTVQVGDPFAEKLLIEACLELMQEEAILSIQDMGAAGLTSSSIEMASKGNTGIELALEHVPLREAGMTPYEIMLSESQERMLVVIKPGAEAIAQAIFNKWQLPCVKIGDITTSKHIVLTHHGEVVADLPIDALTDSAPQYQRPWVPTKPRADIAATNFNAPKDYGATLLAMLASPNLCSKRWIHQQYDSTVQADTIAGPGGDAALVRVHGTDKVLGLTTDCTPRYCFADAKEGAKQAVVETWRNLIASGAKPLAITNCLNFGNPQKPEVMGQIVQAIEGIAEACLVLDYPVVSGNVSLYNETNGQAILPTPAIGGVGLMSHYSLCQSTALQEVGLDIWLLGTTKGHLGSSLYLQVIENREEGACPPVNLAQEKKHGLWLLHMQSLGLIKACHDIADGGLLIALAEMVMAGKVGATCSLPAEMQALPAFAALFGEDQGRYILAAKSQDRARLEQEASAAGITIAHLGATTEKVQLALPGLLALDVAAMRTAHESTLPRYMA
jgi:phosphoribosylformylglycinamidine synthase II